MLLQNLLRADRAGTQTAVESEHFRSDDEQQMVQHRVVAALCYRSMEGEVFFVSMWREHMVFKVLQCPAEYLDISIVMIQSTQTHGFRLQQGSDLNQGIEIEPGDIEEVNELVDECRTGAGHENGSALGKDADQAEGFQFFQSKTDLRPADACGLGHLSFGWQTPSGLCFTTLYQR